MLSYIYILREGERVRSGGFGSVKERERGALVEFLESKMIAVCAYTPMYRYFLCVYLEREEESVCVNEGAVNDNGIWVSGTG